MEPLPRPLGYDLQRVCVSLEHLRAELLCPEREDSARAGAGAGPVRAHLEAGMTGRVLVVEDDPTMVQVLAEIFRQAGLTVATAAEGHEGLARLREQPVDAIVCNLMMPRLDGRGFYAGLVGELAAYRQRVVFLSGQLNPSASGQAFGRECVRFVGATGAPAIEKPCEAGALIAAVDGILRGRR